MENIRGIIIGLECGRKISVRSPVSGSIAGHGGADYRFY
jgi:hypothetical protein